MVTPQGPDPPRSRPVTWGWTGVTAGADARLLDIFQTPMPYDLVGWFTASPLYKGAP